MTAIAPQLEAVYTHFIGEVPEPVREAIEGSLADADTHFKNATNLIKVDSKFPEFSLPSASHEQVSSRELLNKGPLLITFYRGGWCPFCNIALHSLQEKLDEIHAAGVELVAITPELPDSSLSTKEKNELTFEVLSDVGNKLASEVGIAWKQPANLKPILKQFDTDLEKINGDDSWEVPAPATFLVGKDGVVKNMYFDSDYRKRVEPSAVMEWIGSI